MRKTILLVLILAICLLLSTNELLAQGQPAYESVSPRRLPGVTIVDEKDGVLWVWMLTGYFGQSWLPNPQNSRSNQSQQNEGTLLPEGSSNYSFDIHPVHE
jgi:hypothetical protein